MEITIAIFNVTEIVGTIAFAVSGALIAIERRLDLFGVLFLGIVTALGGGTMRDILLGVFPPRAFYNYEYLAIAFFSALAVFIVVWSYRAHYTRFKTPLESINNVFDAIGLATFSIAGSQIAVAQGYGGNPFLCVFLGMTTGIGGGIIRDICSKEVPFVFQKHVYGVASLVGCVAYWGILRLFGNNTAATLAGVFLIIVIRICATGFRWNLPRIRLTEKK